MTKMGNPISTLARWLVLAISLLLLFGCRHGIIDKKAAEDRPSQTAETGLATPSPEVTAFSWTRLAGYLNKVIPPPDSALTMQEFIEVADAHEPSFRQGEGVCVELNPLPLIPDLETRYCEQLIGNQVRLKVDDDDMGNPVWINPVCVKMEIVDQDLQVHGETCERCQACWRPSIGPGLHTARLEVETWRGPEVYVWKFTLTED